MEKLVYWGSILYMVLYSNNNGYIWTPICNFVCNFNCVVDECLLMNCWAKKFIFGDVYGTWMCFTDRMSWVYLHSVEFILAQGYIYIERARENHWKSSLVMFTVWMCLQSECHACTYIPVENQAWWCLQHECGFYRPNVMSQCIYIPYYWIYRPNVMSILLFH